MVDRKLISLVKGLHNRTTENKVKWEKTSEEGVFLASFHNYSLSVSTIPSKTGAPTDVDIVIRIFDGEGNVIEEISDLDFDKQDFGETHPYHYFNYIYSMARRQSMGVDKALDSLLKELNVFDDPDF